MRLDNFLKASGSMNPILKKSRDKRGIFHFFVFPAILIVVLYSCLSSGNKMYQPSLLPPEILFVDSFKTLLIIPYDQDYLPSENLQSSLSLSYILHVRNENGEVSNIRIVKNISYYQFIYHLDPGRYTITDLTVGYFGVAKHRKYSNFSFTLQYRTATILPFKVKIELVHVKEHSEKGQKILYPVINLIPITLEEKNRIDQELKLTSKFKNYSLWEKE